MFFDKNLVRAHELVIAQHHRYCFAGRGVIRGVSIMVYFIVSLIGGVVGGLLFPHIAADHTLGPVGNAVTGFLGGAAANVIVLLALGGTTYIVALVAGVLGGVVVRVGFSVIKQRLIK